MDLNFDIIDTEAITSGRATDAYFNRTETTLRHAGRNPSIVAEVTADQFPDGNFEMMAGVKNVVALLEGRDIDVDAILPGRLFDGGPVLRIRGNYLDFAKLETSILGFLSHASGIATAASDARTAAPSSTILSFGARHVHPTIAAMVERSALIAGVDGFSHVAAGDILDRTAGGTMPHALLICFGRGEQEQAWQAFDEAVPEDVPRIALCDTYSDEADEALRAARAFGDRLDGIRLDTTGSRRGDFRHIIREVQWTLDTRGYGDIDIFVSGGLKPEDLVHLRDVVDGFGIGGYISTADPVDFALDIVSVNNKSVAKRGKLAGIKSVYRTSDGGHHIGLQDRSLSEDSESLLKPVIKDGNILNDVDFGIDAAAQRATQDCDRCGYEINSK
ncbi:nicotinate phosphoribosyltransferase [Haloquadratum walsbyi]|jgi:Nicotinic acid phosphoribosyltransferase|uniref:nicotinate phosphoribosyltransferase n=1 Tax=Haloquadratum walsbyi J07HQW2 TaxID=1238425 RepID=U1NGP9_9EURY|nr:nicotinate phosphoribosyltransferase [Haloquadratum walsbyi]ERG96013.1 MAG: nicotinic acid phosphoribosyltransferase [Haloquadratum walsbyi J07HQW2]